MLKLLPILGVHFPSDRFSSGGRGLDYTTILKIEYSLRSEMPFALWLEALEGNDKDLR